MKINRIAAVQLAAFILASCAPAAKIPPVETAMPILSSASAPTAAITYASVPLIPKERFTSGYLEIGRPSQDLITRGMQTGVLRQEMDVTKLVFDVHDNKNHPDQKVVFARNPETHEIVLATRVNPSTGEMSWYVAGLRDLADVLGMTIGTQLYSPNSQLFTHEDIQKINALVVQEYNHAIIIEAGWPFTEYDEGKFDFTNADAAVSLAVENGMTPECDDLIYGLSDFKYGYLGNLEKQLRNQGWKDEQIKQKFATLVKNHIVQVMSHFKGRMEEYSTLNEWRGQNTDMPDRYSVIFGNDEAFIKMVFQTARETDPAAKLFYNDNDINTSGDYGFPYALSNVQMLEKSGLIDAVGIQMTDIHVANPPGENEIVASMQSWGIPVMVSSATFQVQDVSGTDLEVQQRQAEVAVRMLNACVKSGVCKDFRFWDGYGDKFAFQGANTKSTIFDENMRPKLAYFAIKEYLAGMIDGNNGQ